jgi:DNA-binding GntR family transcriptional regulator
MREIDLINELMVELKDAAASKQWARLQDIDRRVAEQLAVLSQHQPLSKEMQGALNKLQYLYVKTFEHCQKEHEALAEKMAELRRNRDGMAAYGAMDDTE